ncbi:type VII secretion integral membrane protein EccD [Nocardiopsis sp. MG754419]|uniref:type VII secretion integral membrane protein EccD n=1 Tax=Nocardiopsis sp. MG754419 TaxID=2259865 RepID=UPI001BA74D98|nr:type VII secretion integral membrane protein EccD [Nocardiopsis sp. MG754419]MBR8743369.1 type VII secretion integral membrane protein EccD [Nocardiopsis sp. MG754419]
MSDSPAPGLCRLVVRAPDRTFEIAVPTDVPLSELLPTIVLYAEGDSGDDLDESGLEHDGWVLQQLGSPALEEDGSVLALGLFDGETLYLRPRRDQLPPIHFDDLIDGVANGMAERRYSWRPTYTRRLLHGLSVSTLFAGFVILAMGGMNGLTALIAGGAAVILLLGAWAASRAMGDLTAATALAAAAVLYMGLAGAAIPTGDPGIPLLGARVLAACMAAAGATVLGLAAVAGSVPFFAGLIVFEVFGVLSAVALMLAPGLTMTGIAGAASALAILIGTFAPVLGFRIAGLRLPPLPSNTEQLQEAIDPHPARDVLDRTTLADGYQGAVLAATGAIHAIALFILAPGPGWLPITLGVVISLVLLFQSRGLANAGQKLCLTVPAYGGLVFTVLAAAADAGTLGRLLALLGVLAAAATLTALAWSMPGRRGVPHWGRAAEIIQLLAAIAMVCLVFGNLGLYGMLRGIGG